MKMQKASKIIILGIILAVLGVFCRQAFAFNLTCDGRNRLEFNQGNFSNNNFSQEINFSTSGTLNTEYEIRQRINRPLTSGSDRISSDKFQVRGIRGSNHYGRLFIPTGGTPWGIVVENGEAVYHSDSAGTADTFTLAYAITDPQDLASGNYTGQIALILIPINSPNSQVNLNIDVSVSITNDGGSLSVSVAPAEGASSIIINSIDTNNLLSAANAVVTINSSFDGPFSIMQMLPSPIRSEDGKIMDNNRLLFSIPDARKGVTPYQQPSPVSNNIQAIYSPRLDGSADKAFTIAYSLADPLSLAAGNYRSRIQYLLKFGDKQINLGALDLEIRQERIFEISITPQDQRYSIDFADLKPSDGPRLNEVIIEVKSNLGRPYQVTQEVLSELKSAEGEKIPAKYFSLQTLSVDHTKGNLKIANKIPVEKGNLLLFVSDNNGSTDKFKVIYELICPADLRAGNYSSRITYTLTEI